MDREKVMDALRRCPVNKCDGCPYKETYDKYGYGCLNELDMDALELLEEQDQPTVAKDIKVPNKWVSVKDRLPDAAGYECLVCAVNTNYNQTHVFTAHTGYGEPGWWTGNVNYMSKATSPYDNRLHPALKVTHWMPLPEPPKEDKDGE